MSRRYRAFGLTLESELDLRLPEAASDQPADVEVRLRSGDTDFPELPYSLGKITYGRAGDEILVRVPWAADFRVVKDGITIFPAGEAQPLSLALYLTGLILVFHLRLRNLLTFHGSAVAIPSGALVLVGNQGSGKSTTAAHLSRRGYPVLCDDAVPLVPGPLVMPGIPLSKLLPDAWERLSGGAPLDPALWDGVDKYQVPLASSQESRRLSAFLILSPQESLKEPERRLLKGREKFTALISHLQMISGLDEPKMAFEQLTDWLKNTPVWLLSRPTHRDSVDAVLSLVEEIITEAGK